MTRKPIRVLAAVAAIVVVGFAVAAVSRDHQPQAAIVDMNHGDVKFAKGELKRIQNAVAATTAAVPEDELAARGRKIFRDGSLFERGESCQTCHAEGTTSPRLGTMVHDTVIKTMDPKPSPLPPSDFDGQRDPPTLIDLAKTAPYFWNGSVPTLAQAVAAPVFGHMAPFVPGGRDVDLAAFVAKLDLPPVTGDPDCASVAPDGSRDAECVKLAGEIASALTAYIKTITPPATSFDEGTMSEDARLGEKLFQGKGGCIECHGGPDFTDNLVHNTGVPQITFKSPFRPADAPDVASNDLGASPPPPDPGCAGTPVPLGCDPPKVTPGLPCDPRNQVVLGRCSAFINTPVLRDLANSAPYMHNGAFKTLKEVVQFYNSDSALSPLNLSDPEIDQLVAYLESL
jgi:cytochrome c peroxidase